MKLKLREGSGWVPDTKVSLNIATGEGWVLFTGDITSCKTNFPTQGLFTLIITLENCTIEQGTPQTNHIIQDLNGTWRVLGSCSAFDVHSKGEYSFEFYEFSQFPYLTYEEAAAALMQKKMESVR